jgi:predicted acetyltransferase
LRYALRSDEGIRLRLVAMVRGVVSEALGSVMQTDLTLRLPRQDEEEEFLRAHRATSQEVPYFLHYYKEGMAFSRYLEVLAERERGIDVPPNHVRSTFLFAFVGPRIVGRVSIRHSLNPLLERVGGHIGYVVVPEFRRRGYATTILRLSVQIAREKLGIGRILVTCDDDNIGSIRTIEKNGGILDNVVSGRDLDKPKRRYWIEAFKQMADSRGDAYD